MRVGPCGRSGLCTLGRGGGDGCRAGWPCEGTPWSRVGAGGSAELPRALPPSADEGKSQTLRTSGLRPGQVCPKEARQPGTCVPGVAGTCRRRAAPPGWRHRARAPWRGSAIPRNPRPGRALRHGGVRGRAGGIYLVLSVCFGFVRVFVWLLLLGFNV